MSDAPRYDYKASMTVIYFGIGFLVGAIPTVVLLTLVGPRPVDVEPQMRMVLMLLPVAVGLFVGVRTALVGRRDRVRLVPALARAFFLGSRG